VTEMRCLVIRDTGQSVALGCCEVEFKGEELLKMLRRDLRG